MREAAAASRARVRRGATVVAALAMVSAPGTGRAPARAAEPAEADALLGRLRRNVTSPPAGPALLSRYVYQARTTRQKLKDDKVEKTETREYEVRYRDGRP